MINDIILSTLYVSNTEEIYTVQNGNCALMEGIGNQYLQA